MVYEVAVTAGEIICAAREIVWTIRGLVLNAATTFAMADEIVSADARVFLAIGEIPANAATTSSTVAGIILAANGLVLMAETIVLRAATTPAILWKTLKTKGNLLKTVKCCVLLTNSSSPPTPKVDKLF